MVKPFVPLLHEVEVYTPGELVKDRFNNLRPGPGVWRRVKVAAWWVHGSEERDGQNASVLRTIDMLTLHVPSEAALSPGGKVRLPDGSVWEVEGHGEDFNHGWHGFVPGLLVIHAKKVEG